jgi:regulation of enolase protein 1 (concanavalin A-like superfamily)
MFERRGIFTLFAAAALALALALPAAAQNVLPAGFAGKAVGEGGGSIKDEGGKLTIQGEGADEDNFFFVSREVTGNGNITARLNSATGGAEAGLEKAGLMIRGDLDPDAAYAMIHEQDENHGLALRWREEKGGDTAVEAGYARRTFPLWLRIQRVGNQVTGFFSSDGQLWSATSTKTVSLGNAAHFGIAVSSGEDEKMMTTEFDNVSVGTDLLVPGLQACGNANGVALTWQPVEGATGYLVFRGTPNIDRSSIKQDQLVQISKDPIAAGTTTFADTDAALQPGARAVYAVAPVMADGKQGPFTVALAGKAGPPVSPLPDYTVSVFGEHKEGDCPQGSVGAAMDAATGVVTLRGGGLDFWSGGEHSVWLTQKRTGNFRATVQILDFPLGVNPCCGKAGLFVRESLTRQTIVRDPSSSIGTRPEPRSGQACSSG